MWKSDTDLIDLRSRVASVTEASEWTVVHGVTTGGVSNPRHDVLVPVQVASLQCRLEAGENRDVVFQGVLLPAAVVPVVRVVRHGTATGLGDLRRYTDPLETRLRVKSHVGKGCRAIGGEGERGGVNIRDAHFVYDLQVPSHKLSMQHLPLRRRESGIQRG